AAKPEIVVANKLDIPGARDGLARLQAALPGKPVIGTSTVTNEGISALLSTVARLLKEVPQTAEKEIGAGVRVYRLAQSEDDGFTIEVDRTAADQPSYRVRGRRVERMTAMTDLASEEGV